MLLEPIHHRPNPADASRGGQTSDAVEELSFYDAQDRREPLITQLGGCGRDRRGVRIVTPRPNSGEELVEILGRVAAGLRERPDLADALTPVRFNMVFNLPAPPRVEKMSWVYFATDGTHIKVGFTTDLDARMKSLARGRLASVRMLADAFGDREDEKRLLAALRPFRWKSEWHHDVPAVRRVMEETKTRRIVPDNSELEALCSG